jgi:hypothetical protein
LSLGFGQRDDAEHFRGRLARHGDRQLDQLSLRAPPPLAEFSRRAALCRFRAICVSHVHPPRRSSVIELTLRSIGLIACSLLLTAGVTTW